MSHDILVANLTALAHLTVDLLPGFIVRSDTYMRLRHLLSRSPKRFEISGERAVRPEDWPGRRLATRDTHLVVEGFPGSGNSFVSNCLRDAVAGEWRIESHFHYTAQLKRAMALKVPVVVIVREPSAAWRSLKSKEPALFDTLIALRWILYHSYVRRHFESLHVFLFEDVTADLDLLRRNCSVVRALTAGRIGSVTEHRRASEKSTAIDEFTPLLRFMKRQAETLYREIREGRRLVG